MSARYFFDAYALVRLHEGKPSYERFSQEAILTERGHLYEFLRERLKRGPARAAREALRALRATRIEPTDEDLLQAAKLCQRDPRMSAQDALGYTIARREGLLFLTGDSAFRKLPGVEYVE